MEKACGKRNVNFLSDRIIFYEQYLISQDFHYKGLRW